jgi:hypothetical protein
MVLDNLSTPNYGSLALPYHLTIYRVALPVGIPASQVRFMSGNCLQQEVTQALSVVGSHAPCCDEQARFMLSLVMERIQAVIAQFTYIDNGTFCV